MSDERYFRVGSAHGKFMRPRLLRVDKVTPEGRIIYNPESVMASDEASKHLESLRCETPAPTRPPTGRDVQAGLDHELLCEIEDMLENERRETDESLSGTIHRVVADLRDARAANRDLREALQQALPWMGMTQARMENDPHSHPQARTNIKSDIERARAALERAGEGGTG